jgi:hypothetical protein
MKEETGGADEQADYGEQDDAIKVHKRRFPQTTPRDLVSETRIGAVSAAFDGIIGGCSNTYLIELVLTFREKVTHTASDYAAWGAL